MSDFNLAILGCGVMGTAIANAILNSDIPNKPNKIYALNKDLAAFGPVKDKLTHEKIQLCYDVETNKKALADSTVIVLGCKPYMYKVIYEEIKDALNGEQLLISLLAGVTIEELSIYTPYVARIMTNTPAQFGAGTAGIAFSAPAEEKYSDLAIELIGTVGLAFRLPESNMDAATALIGSGPAFVMLMMEAMIDGGIRMGLTYDVARLSAAKVMEGTAKMVLETGEHPAALKAKVCTPGGTTIGGLLKLEDAGVRGAIARCIEEAANISKSFSKK